MRHWDMMPVSYTHLAELLSESLLPYLCFLVCERYGGDAGSITHATGKNNFDLMENDFT